MAAGGSFAFRLLATPVHVRSSSAAALARLRACYGEDHAAADDPVLATIEPHGAGWAVGVAGRSPTTADDLTGAVRALNHELLHALMVRHRHLFFVHAGVVASDGRAIVLPGLSRAGKSTLVLALLGAGAALLSDELLVYEPASGVLLPFPRAVKVRDECVPYFPQFAARFVGTGEGRFLPFATLGGGMLPVRAEPGVIAAPCWDRDGDDRPHPISAGEGLLHLARSALNFGSQRERSIDHLAALAGRSRCFTLRWRNPHTAARALLACLEAR